MKVFLTVTAYDSLSLPKQQGNLDPNVFVRFNAALENGMKKI